MLALTWHPAMQMGADGDLANGWVSDAQLATQIAVLNAAYASLQVSFVAAGVQRLSGQSQWWCATFACCDPHCATMDRAFMSGMLSPLIEAGDNRAMSEGSSTDRYHCIDFAGTSM